MICWSPFTFCEKVSGLSIEEVSSAWVSHTFHRAGPLFRYGSISLLSTLGSLSLSLNGVWRAAQDEGVLELLLECQGPFFFLLLSCSPFTFSSSSIPSPCSAPLSHSLHWIFILHICFSEEKWRSHEERKTRQTKKKETDVHTRTRLIIIKKAVFALTLISGPVDMNRCHVKVDTNSPKKKQKNLSIENKQCELTAPRCRAAYILLNRKREWLLSPVDDRNFLFREKETETEREGGREREEEKNNMENKERGVLMRRVLHFDALLMPFDNIL